MRIKTTSQVNTHLQDGRAVTADEGDVMEISDDDAAMVGLARSLIMSGRAQHYGDAGAVDEEVPVETDAVEAPDNPDENALAGDLDDELDAED